MTFARLLDKVSSEMSSGSEIETTNYGPVGVTGVSITVGGISVQPLSPTSEPVSYTHLFKVLVFLFQHKFIYLIVSLVFISFYLISYKVFIDHWL